MTDLALFVPSADHPEVERMVLPGSAIVGTPVAEGDRVLIDFEGGKYGGEYYARFANRVLHAAGRHVERYPTVARALVPSEQLLHVGWYDVETRTITVDDSEKLAGWIGEYTDDDLRAS